MYVYHNIETHSCKHCGSGKAVSITYSECVSLALFIQYAKRMRHNMLSSVAYPAVPYLYTLCHKQQDFLGGGNITEH
jgi:hypothetical protein